MKSAGGANVTFIGWRAAYLCKRLDMSKRSACLCVKSLFWKDLNFLPLSALETGRDVWLDFVEIIQEKADYKLHNKSMQLHMSREAETMDCMVLRFTPGSFSPSCRISASWKPSGVFLCGHFMSRAAMQGTVWCKPRFNYEVGVVFGRKVCVCAP